MVFVLSAILMFAGPGLADLAGTGVEVGGGFGRATASATSLSTSTIELDLSVEADSADTVVAHLIEPGGTQETLPLVPRGGGVFGIRTEVRKIDHVVVFESLDGQDSSQSQPVRLTELGVNPAVLGVKAVPSTAPDEFSDTTRQWGWAGLGLAAIALTLVALWALPDRRRRAARTSVEDLDGPVDAEGPIDPEAQTDIATPEPTVPSEP
jgi:hypothetical protein